MEIPGTCSPSGPEHSVEIFFCVCVFVEGERRDGLNFPAGNVEQEIQIWPESLETESWLLVYLCSELFTDLISSFLYFCKRFNYF